MNEMNLGRSTLRVPRLGIGAMTWGEPTEFPRWNPARFAYGLAEGVDEQRKALEVCIAAGANLVDTAAFYGKGASERRVGDLVRDKEVLLATKYPFGLFSGAGTLPRDLDDSLSRLQRTTVDLYQIHFPIPWRPIPRLMHLMADAVEAGKVRAVGVSNFSAAQMRQAHAVLATRGIPLASNQVEYSLLHRAPEADGVLDACRELGVTLIAFQPLASGALTGKYSVANPPTGMRRHAPMFRRDNLELLSPLIMLLKEIGERYQKSPGQVALRWLIERGALPIPGAKNSSQAAHNAGALGFILAAGEMEAIEKATTVWRK
jgi:aryl-alcohol dehydrogenase-like predicted oxidoreductase